MAILTSDHLLAQADGLLSLFPKRKPRQTELRRAVSAAYYGVYHFVLKQAADEYVGARYGRMFPPAPQYVLAYRSVSHMAVHSLCSELKKPNLPEKLRGFDEPKKFGPDLRRFSASFVDLQERRHSADYDISVAFSRTQAISTIALARTAIECFEALSRPERQIFLALLLFPLRGKT